jgi:phosphoribosylformylglycinamidine (FGAM) synthase-like amidotransferase family enzyme
LCQGFQVFCSPGGFSYGDDVAAGRILGNQIRYHLAERMAEFKAQGRLILGICNGFQVLIKSGVLLEGDRKSGPPATLTYNDSGKFEDRWVRLEVCGNKSVFFAGIESMYLPVAHAEGKFVARDETTLERLDAEGQLVLRYVALHPEKSAAEVGYPANPNGSMGNVAGVCEATHRPHATSPMDPGRGGQGGRRPAGVRERSDVFRLAQDTPRPFGAPSAGD